MSLQNRFKKPAVASAPVIPFTGPRLLSLKQAAQYVGISLTVFRQMIARREIPHIPKGEGLQRNHVLVDRLDLDVWIQRRKVGAAE